jgi:osmotically-inducible protein OsmY
MAKNAESENAKRLNRKLTDEVRVHLNNHKEIDTTNVDVSAKGTTVNLSGHVDNPHAKRLAGNITEQEIKRVEHVVTDDLAFDRDNNEPPKKDNAESA